MRAEQSSRLNNAMAETGSDRMRGRGREGRFFVKALAPPGGQAMASAGHKPRATRPRMGQGPVQLPWNGPEGGPKGAPWVSAHCARPPRALGSQRELIPCLT